MPFTPYHFGPSGFVGLVFRRWLDIPVFVLANVVVDVEVLVVGLFGLGWPTHRYCHTLLVGTAVGAVWGLLAYTIKPVFRTAMQLVRLPYQTSLLKMVISGVLGVWFHVFIDAFYWRDVKIFWPSRARPLWRLLSQPQVKAGCIVFLIAAVILYAAIVKSYIEQNKSKKQAAST